MNSGTLTLFQSKTDNFALAYAGPETNIVICLPTKHLGVLITLLNVSVLSSLSWNLEVLVFEERVKLEYPEKNLLE